MAELLLVRPRLRLDTVLVPQAAGITVYGGRGAVTLRGRHVARWLERLRPLLDGAHTLGEITDGLTPGQGDMVLRLVDALASAGVVRDACDDEPHGLDPAERAAYTAELAHLEARVHSPERRFERFRESAALLVGCGRVLTAAVEAALRAGLRQLTVMATPGTPVDARRHQEILEVFHERDPRQRVAYAPCPPRLDAVADAAVDGFAVVVHASDVHAPGLAAALDRACAARGRLLAQATVAGGRGWLAALPAAGERECWACVWRGVSPAAGTLGAGPPAAGAALLANLALFAVFEQSTGAASPGAWRELVEVDLETLDVRRRPVETDRACAACAVEAVR